MSKSRSMLAGFRSIVAFSILAFVVGSAFAGQLGGNRGGGLRCGVA